LVKEHGLICGHKSEKIRETHHRTWERDGARLKAMTVKVEMELRQEAEKAEVSNNYGPGGVSAGLASANRYWSEPNDPGVQNARALALPQFSARQVYFTVALYGILLSSALWVSVNLLKWVWHRLL
jgi:hypothetical protein